MGVRPGSDGRQITAVALFVLPRVRPRFRHGL